MRGLVSNKILAIITVILIFLLGVGVGFWWGRSYSGFQNLDSQSAGDSAQEKSAESGDFVGEYKVTRVIDGDTIEIEGGERVDWT